MRITQVVAYLSFSSFVLMACGSNDMVSDPGPSPNPPLDSSVCRGATLSNDPAKLVGTWIHPLSPGSATIYESDGTVMAYSPPGKGQTCAYSAQGTYVANAALLTTNVFKVLGCIGFSSEETTSYYLTDTTLTRSVFYSTDHQGLVGTWSDRVCANGNYSRTAPDESLAIYKDSGTSVARLQYSTRSLSFNYDVTNLGGGKYVFRLSSAPTPIDYNVTLIGDLLIGVEGSLQRM